MESQSSINLVLAAGPFKCCQLIKAIKASDPYTLPSETAFAAAKTLPLFVTEPLLDDLAKSHRRCNSLVTPTLPASCPGPLFQAIDMTSEQGKELGFKEMNKYNKYITLTYVIGFAS
jgi:hypothetical protein